MALKHILYFGGIVPAVFGGGLLGHWFSQNKTIGDALRKIGKTPFEKAEDFQKVYDKYRGSEGFKKAIPNATSGQSVANWCNYNLNVELTEKSKKELLPKVEKYCTEFKEIVIEDTSIARFGDLMSLINDNTVRTNNVKREGVLSFVYNGSYYCAQEVENVGDKTKFEECTKPRDFYSVYIPEKYGLISKFGNDSKWDNLVEKYLKSGRKLGLKLKETISVRDSSGRLIQQQNVRNSDNRNELMTYCYGDLLKRQIRDQKTYKEVFETAVSWCTEHGLKLDAEFELSQETA